LAPFFAGEPFVKPIPMESLADVNARSRLGDGQPVWQRIFDVRDRSSRANLDS